MTEATATDLVQEAMQRARDASIVSATDLVIWGGVVQEAQGSAFLQIWSTQLVTEMPWRMIEAVSDFHVYRANATNPALPASWPNLERARFFGPAGDLDLRRDGDSFRWRFIGERNVTWPQLTDYRVHDFWESVPPAYKLRLITHRYYQWRRTDREQRVTSRWVADADLPPTDTYLVQNHYLNRGRVEFVRYVDLSGNQ